MFKVYFYCSLYYNRSIALQQRLIYLCRLFEISENFKIVIMRDRRGEEYVNVVIYYLFFCGFGKLLMFGIKAAWGISKFLLTIVLLPVILIGLVVGGLIYLAFPILIVVGIVGLLL